MHGGLRYLATGNVGIARRSAIERGILMTRNAPHLVKAMPQLVPLLPSMNTRLTGVGAVRFRGRRRRCASWRAPRRRRCRGPAGSTQPRAIEMAPTVRRDGLSGGLLAYDGQLIDDARLVTAVARTAAQHGARILTHVGASNATGTSVTLTDQRSGEIVRGVGARRDQRQRRVGGRGGLVDPVAAQPRNPPGVRRRGVRQSRLRR